MKKQLLLALSLLGSFSFNDVNAAGKTNWLNIARGFAFACGSLYIGKKVANINGKKIDHTMRYKHGFEKLIPLVGVGVLSILWQTTDPQIAKSQFASVVLASTLIGTTHAIANHDTVIKNISDIPYAGPIFTDVDENGHELPSVGVMTRYIATYMVLRSAASWLITKSGSNPTDYLMM